MNKVTRLNNRQLLYVIGVVLIIGSYVATAVLWRHQRAVISSLNGQLQTVTDNLFAMSGGSYMAVTIIPSEDAVYLPLAKLKLPATTLNEKLVYSYKPVRTIPGGTKVLPAEVNIATHDLSINNFSTEQFDCSQVAYADFTTPSYPVNPKYKSDGTITLADGRAMNIYYAPSISGCEVTWQVNGVDAKAIADSLKQAVSY